MPAKFAAQTEVTADRSRGEIERTLQRYGATSFMYGWDEGRAIVGFRMAERQIRFLLPMPDRDDPEFTFCASGRMPRKPSVLQTWEELAPRQAGSGTGSLASKIISEMCRYCLHIDTEHDTLLVDTRYVSTQGD